MSPIVATRLTAAILAAGFIAAATAPSFAGVKQGAWQPVGQPYNVSNTKKSQSACRDYVKKVRDPKTGRIVSKRLKACTSYSSD